MLWWGLRSIFLFLDWSLNEGQLLNLIKWLGVVPQTVVGCDGSDVTIVFNFFRTTRLEILKDNSVIL